MVGRRSMALFLLLLVGLAACKAQGVEPSRKRQVTIRLTWKWKAEHAPLAVAVAKGFAAAEGLDLQVAEGGGVSTVLALLAEGREAMAFGSAEAAVRAIDSGMDLQIVQIYGVEAPWAVVARPGLAITSLRDLEGRSLGLAAEGTFEAMLDALAARGELDLARVRLVRLDEGAKAAQLLGGRIDLAAIYLNNQLPLWEERLGEPLSALPLSRYNLRLPGAALITSRAVARDHPELLHSVAKALDQAYSFAAEHPDETAAMLAERVPAEVSPAVLQKQIQASLALRPSPGWPTTVDWEQILDQMEELGLIQNRQPAQRYHAFALPGGQ